MELDTPDNLEYILDYPMDERTEAVFLHEYIHYMQDLMTITGLARIETIVDQIKWAVDKISNCKNLRLPLILETNFYSLKANATSLLICKGDFKKIVQSDEKIGIITEKKRRCPRGSATAGRFLAKREFSGD
jgi:hypothetical protein